MSLEESAPPSDVPRGARSRTSISAERLAAQLLDDEDRAFLDAMRGAGLLSELDQEELLRVASEVSDGDTDERCVTMLELYFEAAGDVETSARRRLADRFFIQRMDEPVTATALVSRLVSLTPELDGVTLERIGGDDGPLVLRAGDHHAAVLDDEDDPDTGEIDLRAAELRKSGVAMVTVRGLVRALNVLLDRHGVRERLIAIRGDHEREIYAGLGVTQALSLTRAGYLEDDDAEDVLELGAW